LPRFYFDISVGDDFTRDGVGFDYESLEVAEYEAARAASEIGHDNLPRRRTSEICVCVRDKEGFLLCTVEVAVAVHRTIRALA
jgi:hypothetical protein